MSGTRVSELWAIDPGKHCGLSRFNWETGEHIISVRIDDYNLLTLIGDSGDLIARFVIEDFISRGGITKGSRNEASQIIGAVKLFARGRGIQVIRQAPGDRFIGAKFAGVKLPKGHTPDEKSSYCHGVKYLRSQGKFKTILEKKHGR